LQKWITSYEKTVEGVTEVITTEQNHESSRDDKAGKLLVKIDLDEKKLASTSIKIKYTIRVENKGNIPGYVKEVTDFIPSGLEFFVEDNLDQNSNAYWAVDGDQLVTADGYVDKLNTILNPGEAHEFTLVLRWTNSKENLGTKTNTAEISKDYNEWEVPDVDSDPGNFNRENWNNWEDEEDEVPLLLAVKTGEWIIYFGVVLGVLAVGLVATIIIKKKLVNRI